MEKAASHAQMMQILKDTGIAQEQQEHIMEFFQCGQWEKGRKVLLRHRSSLLSELHDGQDKLYYLDFLLRKVQQVKCQTLCR